MVYAMFSIGILGFLVWSHHMFSVGLDVDTLVSKVMVTLLISIGLYAGKLDYFIGPLSKRLFGKIQSLKKEPYFTKIKSIFILIKENKQSAGNFYLNYLISMKNILNHTRLRFFSLIYKLFSTNSNNLSEGSNSDSYISEPINLGKLSALSKITNEDRKKFRDQRINVINFNDFLMSKFQVILLQCFLMKLIQSGMKTTLKDNIGTGPLDLELYFFVGNPLNNSNYKDKMNLTKDILCYSMELLSNNRSDNTNNYNQDILSFYKKFNLICNQNLDSSILLDKDSNQSEEVKIFLRNIIINVTNHINMISKNNILIQNSKIKSISLSEDLYFLFKIEGFNSDFPIDISDIYSKDDGVKKLYVKSTKSKFSNRKYSTLSQNPILTNQIEYDKTYDDSIDIHTNINTISDHISNHMKPKSSEDLGYYLAGLIEGDGYFGDHRFEIAFHENDTFLAFFIKKEIGYGSVLKFKNKRSVRYVLRHSEGLKKVLNLVNGKFLYTAKLNQLLKHQWDKKFDISILPSGNFDIVSNYWLAGFTDADGSFVITLINSTTHKLKMNVRLEFKIKQKKNKILEIIKQTFGGHIYYLKSEELFYYNSISFKSAKSVISYFDNFQLISSKWINYLKWRKIYRIIQRKEHLTIEGLNKIKKIKGSSETNTPNS